MLTHRTLFATATTVPACPAVITFGKGVAGDGMRLPSPPRRHGAAGWSTSGDPSGYRDAEPADRAAERQPLPSNPSRKVRPGNRLRGQGRRLSCPTSAAGSRAASR